MQISGQGIKMCATVKPHNTRDMTKEMEQVKMRMKASMLRNITLILFSTSSVTSGSASGPSELKRGEGHHRGSNI